MPEVSYFIREIRNKARELQNRRRIRALAIAISAGLVIVQVFPTLAENSDTSLVTPDETSTVLSPLEENTLNPEESPSPIESQSPDLENESFEESADSSGAVDSEATSPSPPPPPPPPYATSDQTISIIMPNSVRVDPRATSVFLPRMLFYSFNTLLVCISSNSLRFDIGTQGVVDDVLGGDIMILGDQSNYLLISGHSVWVNGYLNSELGMRIFSDSAGIGKKSVFFRIIDISEPSINDELCLDGSTSNYRSVQIVPLGLNQSISKGSVGLKKGGR